MCTCRALSRGVDGWLLCEVAVEGVAQGVVEGGQGDAVRALEADQAVKLLKSHAVKQCPGSTCAHRVARRLATTFSHQDCVTYYPDCTEASRSRLVTS